MNREDIEKIQDAIENYFKGIYHGDTELLKSVFHPKALLFGDIQGQTYFKNVPEYIEGVKNRKSPGELGEKFRMQIISIERLGEIAFVNLHVPMFDFNYYDYLS